MSDMMVSPQSTTSIGSGFLGKTIEEKTRRILGWTENYTPSLNNDGAQRRADKLKKSKTVAKISTEPYPYSLLNSCEKGRRKGSTSSTCSNASFGSVCSGGETNFLRQQLTPPPSPRFTVQGMMQNCVAQSRRNSAPCLQPPSYHNATAGMLRAESASPPKTASPYFPISPVSPNTPNPTATIAPPTSPRAPTQGRVTAKEVFERLKVIPNLSSEQSKYRALIQTVTHVIELENRLANLKAETKGLNEILISRQHIHVPTQQQQQMGRTQNPVLQAADSMRASPPLIAPYGPHNTRPAVPDDLINIDVSAFRELVDSPVACQTFCYPATTLPDCTSQSCVEWDTPNLGFTDSADLFANFDVNGALDGLCVDTTYGQAF